MASTMPKPVHIQYFSHLEIGSALQLLLGRQGTSHWHVHHPE